METVRTNVKFDMADAQCDGNRMAKRTISFEDKKSLGEVCGAIRALQDPKASQKEKAKARHLLDGGVRIDFDKGKDNDQDSD